ncbi:F-box domain [Arabidopsis thaliana x Arabidopsis arenosa]|uniref:F-box domain n=1 Tax=Arabidopsis thaliana x Arabidopsis arenosa TaxID=1240361 RepID=A0A8T1Y6H3_9BRAS|nr:F-box domain [Arabidopsis thaliana x Arabidopsis arenosa]
MDKVGKKNPQCITWSKKRDQSEENDLFSSIPLELIIEILLKLPAKSVARLMFVSKHWSSIILDKDFTELYLTRSSTLPRLLLTVSVYHLKMQFLYSGALEDPYFDNHRVPPSTPDYWQFSPPVRGLICCLNATKMLIGNPSTGQFITLPRVKTRKCYIYIHSFFGYDPVNDLYKVLCMTTLNGPSRGTIGTEEHQVFTLGAQQEWRMIECKHRHRLDETQGICMNGVVYYLASFNDELSKSLISFNLSSEDFDVIHLPEDIKHRGPYSLVNYSGKIAITSYSCDGTLDLWVIKDASKQEWSKATLLVPCLTNFVGDQRFRFKGTFSTGELIFAPCTFPNPYFFIYYDLKGKKARKLVIEEIRDDLASFKLFLDHVESPMFLPKVCLSDDD